MKITWISISVSVNEMLLEHGSAHWFTAAFVLELQNPLVVAETVWSMRTDDQYLGLYRENLPTFVLVGISYLWFWVYSGQ